MPQLVEYTSAGSYTWQAPAGVTSVDLTLIGAGANGSNSGDGDGGGGGAFIYKTGVPVVPGNNYHIVVGAHGNPNGTNTTWETTIFVAGGGQGRIGGTASGSGTPTNSNIGGDGGFGCDTTNSVCNNCTCDMTCSGDMTCDHMTCDGDMTCNGTTCDNPPDCTSSSCSGYSCNSTMSCAHYSCNGNMQCNGSYNCASSSNQSCTASGGGGSSGTISGKADGNNGSCGPGGADACGYTGSSCGNGGGGVAPAFPGGDGGSGGGNGSSYGGGGGGYGFGTDGYASLSFTGSFDETADGGVLVDGTADNSETATFDETGSGGVFVNSSALIFEISFETGSGGAFANGFVILEAGIFGSGGVFVNGADVDSVSLQEYGNDGVFVAGDAIVPYFYSETGTGGVFANGDADVSYVTPFTSTGGVFASGSDIDSTEIVGTGGLLVAGDSDSTATYNVDASGGIIVSNAGSGGGVVGSGTASLSPHNEIARGGVVLGTTFTDQEYYSSVGGVLVEGEVPIIFFNWVEGTDGAVASGTADVNQRHYVRYTATGTAIADGTFEGGITSRHFNATGEIDVNGTATVNFVFNQEFNYLWRTRAFIKKSVTFLWNTGRLPAYWYRILAKDKCSHDPCCQRYIVNVHARTLTELCSKLTRQGNRFTIESVQKFSTPAETAVIKQQQAAGQTFTCDTFEEVDVCQIAECAEFCVQYDVLERWETDITKLQVDAFLAKEGEGSVFVTGDADTSHVRFLPAFHHVAKGNIKISGHSGTISSGYSYEADDTEGEVELSGEAGIRASHWAFVGGQWPNTTGIRFGNAAQSSPTQNTDQPWSLVERVFSDDNLFCSTDISFGKSSAFLYVQGFNLQVPEDSEIVEIRIVVNRKVTRSGVQDLSAYLTTNNEPISDNAAMLGIDWPLFSDTEVEYDFEGPWDIDIVNSPEFGFGLRVYASAPFSATIAMIDYISAEVVYEDPDHQVVRISGQPDIISSGWSWVGDGGLTIRNSAKVRVALKYMPTGSITVLGQYGLAWDYSATGTVVMGGSGDARPSFYSIVAEGGMVAGAEALVEPYFEFGSGGATVSGSAELMTERSVIGQAGMVVNGFGFVPEIRLKYMAAGHVSMDGEADRGKSLWSWAASGAAIISGSAIQRPSDFGTLFETGNFGMSVSDMSVTFGGDVHLGNATVVGTIINRCDCLDLPLKVNLQHNVARGNNLGQFLSRNNIQIATQLELSYNAINDSWQNNQHFRGMSPNSNTRETWDILFELQCTQETGSQFIGRQIWRLAMEVTRRNLATNEDFDTRLLIGILPDQVCRNNELKFNVTFDTQTQGAQVSPVSTIYQTVFFDNIGLFRSTSWLNNPDMVISVSQGGLSTTRRTVNLQNQVLVT